MTSSVEERRAIHQINANNCCKIQSRPPSSAPSAAEMPITTSVKFFVVSLSGHVTFFNSATVSNHCFLIRIDREPYALRSVSACRSRSTVGFGGRAASADSASLRYVVWRSTGVGCSSPLALSGPIPGSALTEHVLGACRRGHAPFRPLRRSTTWQGRQDSNLQPAVLETAALPIELQP